MISRLQQTLCSRRLHLLFALLTSGLLISCGLFKNRGLPPLPEAVGLAAFPGPNLLVDVTYLRDKLNQPGVKIIDVREHDQYTSGHITGAITIPARLWRSTPDKRLFHVDGDPAKPCDIRHYAQFLGDRGISHKDEVIVYGSPRLQSDAAMPVFILDLLGHKNLHFVDGEALTLWMRSGQSVDRRKVRPDPATYHANPRQELLWNKTQILAAIDKNMANRKKKKKNREVLFWDCRGESAFMGEIRLRNEKYAGRIPSAKHLDFADLYRATRTFQTRFYSELSLQFEKKKLPPKQQIVIYDHDGGRAAYAYLVLRMMDYPRVALYAPSWSEWGNDETVPRATDATKEPLVLPFPPTKALSGKPVEVTVSRDVLSAPTVNR